jgi:hypothetical protein
MERGSGTIHKRAGPMADHEEPLTYKYTGYCTSFAAPCFGAKLCQEYGCARLEAMTDDSRSD